MRDNKFKSDEWTCEGSLKPFIGSSADGALPLKEEAYDSMLLEVNVIHINLGGTAEVYLNL